MEVVYPYIRLECTNVPISGHYVAEKAGNCRFRFSCSIRQIAVALGVRDTRRKTEEYKDYTMNIIRFTPDTFQATYC